MKAKMYFRFLFGAAISLAATLAFGQYAEELYSPFILSSGINSASVESPVGDIFNPAASGGQQRTTIDFGAITFPDFATNMGFAGNFGLTVPTNFGVFSGSIHYINSPFNEPTQPNLGWLTGLNVSFAKDVFTDLYLGIGLQLIFGAQPGTDMAAGGGLDLGLIHFLGDVAFLKDFRYGIAIRGIGYGYTPSQDQARFFPRDFTPSIGANFKLVKSNDFNISLAPDVSLPLNLIPYYNPLLNIKMNLGCEIALFDTVFARANLFNFDIQEVNDASITRWPLDFLGLSFGLTVKFKLPITEKIEALDLSDQTDVKAHSAFTPLQNGVYGLGLGFNIPLGVVDKNPPKITIDTAKTVYVSPNTDGVQDEAALPIIITDERFVTGYKFVITDAAGKEVKTIANKEVRPENMSLGSIFNALGYVKQGVPIPESLFWGGRTDQGAIAPDGAYKFTLEAWDDNGNTVKTSEGTIVLDATPPAATLKTDYLVFSPNGDGNKDTLVINQQGSKEDRWIATVSDNAGKPIMTKEWLDTALPGFEWDAKNSEGALAPDGVYSYAVTSTDRAGNKVYSKVDNIIISTVSTPINIDIGLAHFSPNGDGIKDTERFNFTIPVQTGIEKWSLAIVGSGGSALKTFTGTNEAPGYIDFDGKDDSGKPIPEGTYKGSLSLVYVNGNSPIAATPEFVVDTTPPKASVNANQTVFSPNNDGNKDTITFGQDTSEEDLWSAEVKDKDGKTVKKLAWRIKADTNVVWDGRTDAGALAKDGSYTYTLQSTDKAGNNTVAKAVPFSINTEETPVLVSTDVSYFSPNGDGSVDSISFLPTLKIASDIEKYSLLVKAKDGSTVRTYSAENKTPDSISWNGKDDKGKAAPDGEYRATLNILYKNGNNPVASTNPFFIDTVIPTIEITAQYTLFSPDGDGKKDTFVVEQTSSTEDLWEGTIIGKAGEAVRSFIWKGKAGRLEWDGKNDVGNRIPDGAYGYRIASTDKAGNRVQKEIKAVEIDTRPTPVFLTLGAGGLSPNNDKNMDTIELKVIVENETGIGSWRVDLSHAEKGVQRTFGGTGKVEKSISWNGSTDKDARAEEGIYTATLTVEYTKGNAPSSKTGAFILDATPPALTLNMKPVPFSPDNDGIEDEVTINPVIKDISGIAQWSIEILDPVNKHFMGYSGKGTPQANIRWDGRSDKGIDVESATDYPVTFRATDELGNSSTIKSILPVDILLIKIGDTYKIRIPSITFKPFTPDYKDVEPARREQNLKTLKRLSEIFKKYSTYGIRIEGYALSLLWADPVKAKNEQDQDLLPLSKKRADAIKNGLVELGIEASRIATEGRGGLDPVVPHGDQENNWKNRRVEFLLIKGK